MQNDAAGKRIRMTLFDPDPDRPSFVVPELPVEATLLRRFIGPHDRVCYFASAAKPLELLVQDRRRQTHFLAIAYLKKDDSPGADHIFALLTRNESIEVVVTLCFGAGLPHEITLKDSQLQSLKSINDRELVEIGMACVEPLA